MSYLKEIQKSMKFLAKNKNVIFIFVSLKDVPKSKKIEIPVMEEVQTGMAIGMALNGYIPVSCYPRFDFLILAANQLTNHLDKIDYLTNNNFKSKILIRTMIGSTKPLNAGLQHTQDHTNALKKLLQFSEVIKLNREDEIFDKYTNAISKKNKKKVFIFIEDGNQYA